MNSQDADISKDGKKFHLPGWMVQNIGRFNTTADLDQYACSTLESDGYLPECLSDSCDRLSHDVPSASGVVEKNVESTFKNKADNILPGHKCNSVTNKATKHSPLSLKHHSVVDALKCEDMLYSSPDTSPCVTPEPSPAPQRKISFTSQDTVQSNPQKWFYIGPSAVKPKQIKKKCLQQTTMKPLTTSNISDKGNVHDCNSSVKLTISNFDLNAISPSSW